MSIRDCIAFASQQVQHILFWLLNTLRHARKLVFTISCLHLTSLASKLICESRSLFNMANKHEFVGIVVLNWCNAQDTLACLQSILKLNHTGVHIVICDNASDDNSVEIISQWLTSNLKEFEWAYQIHKDGQFLQKNNISGYERVTLLQTGSNLGFAGGNNVGIRYLQEHSINPHYFWILNNDATVASDSLNHLINKMRSDPSIGICGSRLILANNPGHLQAHGGAKHHFWRGKSSFLGYLADVDDDVSVELIESQLDFICGASMFVSAAFIENIGLMSERYFLYFEELDWAIRGKNKFRLGYEPMARVTHKFGATIGSNLNTRSTSWLSDYYLYLNRIRFTRTHYPIALPTVYGYMLLQAALRILRGQIDRGWLILRLLFGWRKSR